MHRYLLPAVVAAALIAIATIPQGIWSRRFGGTEVTAQRKAFADRIKNIPVAIGDWESKETAVDQRQIMASGSDNVYSRRFTNRLAPEQAVEVFIVSGSGRDITQHTPDQCYVLSGFDEAESQDKYVVDTGRTSADFSTNRFRKGNSSIEGPQNIRILWSFSEDGKWVAPSVQKLLAGAPALYKIYAITELPLDSSGRPEDSAAVPFLRQFMPALTAALFPPEKPAGTTDSNAASTDASAADKPSPASAGAADAKDLPATGSSATEAAAK
jgi:hypothetical protein